MPSASTSFNSGMTQSFHQTIPNPGLPAGTPSQSAATAAINPPKPGVVAQPATGTTSSAPAAPAPITQPVATSKPTTPFKMSLPAGMMANLAARQGGAMLGAGMNAYQRISNMDFMDKAKMYMGNPQNFASILGALSPVASPLVRHAGLPLLLGAYSYLRDPGYLQALSNNKIPKLGAAIPTNNNFEMGTPSVLGTLKSTGSPIPADAVVKAPPTPVQSKPLMSPQTYGIGLGTGALTAGYAAGKSKSLLGQTLGKAIAPALTTAELAGVPEKLTGAPERTWRDVAKSHQEALSPTHWLKSYQDIANDPNADKLDKALAYAGNTVANPYLLSRLDPVGNALSAAKGIDDLTGASNITYALSGGKYGTNPADGQTKSVPVSIATLMQMRQPAPQRRVAPWGK